MLARLGASADKGPRTAARIGKVRAALVTLATARAGCLLLYSHSEIPQAHPTVLPQAHAMKHSAALRWPLYEQAAS